MDFFEQQDKARRKTKLLVLYFALAVAALIVAVYFAVARHFYRRAIALPSLRRAEPQFALWNPQLFLGVAARHAGGHPHRQRLQNHGAGPGRQRRWRK